MKKFCLFILPLFFISATIFHKNVSPDYVVSIKASEFKKIKTIADFADRYKKAACKEGAQFNLVRVAKKQDPVEVICRSFECNAPTLRLIAQAQAGDVFYIDEATTICNKKKIQLEAGAFRIKAD